MTTVAATGVVLAGGASRRMGRDKAALLLDGKPLLARVVRRLRVALPEVIVVGPPERADLVPGTRIIPDTWPGRGPLGGIATALQVVSTPFAFVAACDMPFLEPALIRYLLTLAPGYDAVVPRAERGTEQLHAIYARTCLPAATAMLAAGDLAVARLYAAIRVRLVPPNEWSPYDPAGLALTNINTPEDWVQASRRHA
jgi:molybdopterin-guanine dinucleotide biosynthesis protein A